MNFSSLENLPFFSKKILFSTTSQVLKKWSYTFHCNCQTKFWTLQNRPLRFVKLEYTRKNSPIFFPHWQDFLFFQKIVFSTTSQVLKNCSYHRHNHGEKTLRTVTNCTLRFVTLNITRKNGPKTSFLTLWNCPLMFITLDIRRKNRPKSFLHWKVCLFFPKKKLFSATSFVLKDWSYNDHSNFHNTLCTLTKCPLRFVTIYSTSENRPKHFLHCKNCLY